MADYKILKRLHCITHLVNNYPGISKENVLQRLLNDYNLDVGIRTFERDKSILN